MADALVSIAKGKITELLKERVDLFLGATSELGKISSTFQSIQAVLQDAQCKQVTSSSARVWLSKLKEVSYEIDDLLDEQMIASLESEGSDDDDGGNFANKVLALLSKFPAWFLECCSRYELAWQVKEIRERLDGIATDKVRYSFSIGGNSGGDETLLTSSFQNSLEVIGRDGDKKQMISQLVSSSSLEGEQVRVVAIVGIGGMGKTTLAREIFHDTTVKAHFNKMLWVCVTEKFEIIRVIKAILEEIEGESPSVSELNTLQNKLRKALEGKRFLLVLDNVWNENEKKWEPLLLSLTTGSAGSRVLVTTRSRNVASTMSAYYAPMSANYAPELRGLSGDHCWELFSNRAFHGRKKEERLKLKGIGEEIVKKCYGVPLYLKVMGSVMFAKKKAEDWQNILNSEIFSLPESKTEIVPVLLLSYLNLPPRLKQCFAYCSIYKKDDVMVKDDLVKMWIAQGFIEPQGNRNIEDIGEEYFDKLVALSMFQEVEGDAEETRTSCKMHDLLHDLAQFITKDESGIFDTKNSVQCSIAVRHASILFHNNENSSATFAFPRPKNLRTLFLDRDNEIDTALCNLFHQASYLRVLRICSSKLAMLPKAIGEQKHLRYLDLSALHIVDLPESLSDLPVLLTLNLRGCHWLRRLPSGMGQMVRLRHLELDGTGSLECLPKGLGGIRCLRSLCKFIVGGDGGCGIDELEQLNSLHGSLQILYLERVPNGEEARKAQLWNKPHLRSLELGEEILQLNMPEEEAESAAAEADRDIETMSDEPSMLVEDGDIESDVLEGLKPHANLEKLKIGRCRCSKLPSWMEDSSLSNLTSVRITDLVLCTYLPGLGRLPALKYLYIRNVGARKIGVEFYFGNSSSCGVGRRVAFPKLEQLHLYRLSNLEEWELPSEYNREIIMPSLLLLKLYHCPNLRMLPHHLSKAPLNHLEIIHCNEIKDTGCSLLHLEIFLLEASREFFSSRLPNFPKLKKIEIADMDTEAFIDEGWDQLESLEELQFKRCRRLQSLPYGIGQLKALKSLFIDSESLICLPDVLGQLQSLERLSIAHSEKLESLPDWLGQLQSLERLDIITCIALKSLPDGLGQLKSLKRLAIWNCRKLELLPDAMGQLQSLQILIIYLPGTKSLPDWLGQLESLERLFIIACIRLESLPDAIAQLKALQSLGIYSCYALSSLPRGLQDLPLLRVTIDDCPLLVDRYEMEGGEGWPKIEEYCELVDWDSDI